MQGKFDEDSEKYQIIKGKEIADLKLAMLFVSFTLVLHGSSHKFKPEYETKLCRVKDLDQRSIHTHV